ncbi:MAG: DNA polymerase III [Treponema sp.]|jgi:DNA polymerase-3 subunit gamma/tau|nr:DNA polymerase III [Treponema sp.]
MFENLIGQPALEQIREDLLQSRLAPSMLFWGPPASGKGTAALELARVLSCEATGRQYGEWNCGCPACTRYRLLLHPDLLMLGKRNFRMEIAAAGAALGRDWASASALMLFIRSVRKLMGRFSPVLMEDDSKLSRLNPLLLSLEETLEDIVSAAPGGREKIRDSIIEDSGRLEDEGLSDQVPVAQIRKASWWSRLAPQGKRKFLLIENAGRMQEGARNSLLKILEEPPERLSILLCSSSRETIMPTLLSRLRPYRFFQRDDEAEAEVLRRVFRVKDGGNAGGLSGYLESFLPVSDEGLRFLACFFIASLARKAALSRRRASSTLPEPLISLGKYTAPRAEASGLKAVSDNGTIIRTVLDKTGNFSEAELFSRFLEALLSQVSACFRETLREEALSPAAWLDLWRRKTADADSALKIWNLQVPLVLERLCTELAGGMVTLS